MNTNTKAQRILCYGDSNTWGWIPSGRGRKRYDPDNRWPGILQKKLGETYEIIEEGLGGRTTVTEDPRPGFENRNGLTTLPILLETHLPLHFVILMLGTTETKEMMNLTSKDITEGMRQLIQTIKSFKQLENTASPKILIVVPPILIEDKPFTAPWFKGGTKKAIELVESYAQLAKEEKILYLNPTQEVKVDPEEGLHMDAENHKKLAELIYGKIIQE